MGRRNTVSRKRLIATTVVLLLWGGAIGLRLLDLHVVNAAYYRERAREQHQRELDISPQRGAIRDRRGNDLAISIEVDSLYAEPARVETPAEVAEFLSPILDMSVEALGAKLTDDAPFVYLKRKMTAAQSAAIHAASLPGLGFQRESKRFYPNLQLAAHVLGPVNLDNHGVGGLEYYYDEVIGGTPGRVVLEADARRVAFEQIERSPTEGASLVTTIDSNIQHFAEEEIERTIRETKAAGMSIVAMDPENGEILAMANYPTFNPNEYGRFPEASWTNRAIKGVYEPGSTFKIATAAAVLEEGVGEIDEIVDGMNGAIVVKGTRIRDHKAFGLLTLREVLEYSSNVGMIQFGMRLGDSRFADYIQRFGFGRPSGIDLMGEERGIVRPSDQWSGVSSSFISIGQELGVTPLQILNLVSAVANGGTLYRPYVVSQIEHADGIVERTTPVGEPIMSETTARLIQEAMRGVVTDGTGQAAAIPGFTAAGKTGTAEKIDPSTRTYSSTKYVASFVGFAPATDPVVAIVVVVDEPSGGYYGGEVAAPVFGRLANRVLRYLDAEPDLPPDPRYTEGNDRDVLRGIVTEPVRGTEAPVERSLKLVNASFPLAQPSPSIVGVPLPDRVFVPDYYGRPMREVVAEASSLGLRLLSSGSGVAVEQNPPAGSLVPPQTSVEVRFSTSAAAEARPGTAGR